MCRQEQLLLGVCTNLTTKAVFASLAGSAVWEHGVWLSVFSGGYVTFSNS